MIITHGDSFSPLFIAAFTATKQYPPPTIIMSSFSPLFIAAFTATKRWTTFAFPDQVFQSAFHRGIHCYCYGSLLPPVRAHFQSAFHRGIHCYNIEPDKEFGIEILSVRFSSRHSLLQGFECGNCELGNLSVRFSSRHSLLPM